MKTLSLFFLLVVTVFARDVTFTNMKSSAALFAVAETGDGTTPAFYIQVPPFDSRVADIDVPEHFWTQVDNSGYYDYYVNYSDNVCIYTEAQDVIAVNAVPGWSWFDVAELVFWAWCLYYATKLSLTAVQQLWKMPDV